MLLPKLVFLPALCLALGEFIGQTLDLLDQVCVLGFQECALFFQQEAGLAEGRELIGFGNVASLAVGVLLLAVEALLLLIGLRVVLAAFGLLLEDTVDFVADY
jgi:hypothetical protein